MKKTMKAKQLVKTTLRTLTTNDLQMVAGGDGVGNNPIYQPSGLAGTNPLYQG